jgi:hypothetical protein
MLLPQPKELPDHTSTTLDEVEKATDGRRIDPRDPDPFGRSPLSLFGVRLDNLAYDCVMHPHSAFLAVYQLISATSPPFGGMGI